jgi:hypothetical protein
LVRDFIPAIDDNNVACLYERVEGKFYYNQGTGSFTAGSATGQAVSIGDRARRIKKGYVGVTKTYTPVEYIESSGTQWINTEVLAYNTEMSMKFQYTNLSAVTYVSGSSDGTNRFGLIANRPANNDICYGDKSNNYYTLGTADTNEHTVVYNNSSNQIVYDNVAKGTLPSLTAQVTRPLGLFALSGTNGVANLAHARIMYCRIADKSTNTLVRDFIPVVDQDNVACLYDLVEGKAYYNKGTGTFIAGSATGQSAIVKQVACLCFQGKGGIPTYNATITGGTTQKYWSAIVGTKDYMLEIGGGETGGSTPVKTAKAYSASGVATNAPDLPTQAWWSAAVKFDGLAIVAGGKSANSGGSRTNQCIAYSNNLTRQSLTSLSTSVFSPAAAATASHFFIAGGSDYNYWQTGINAYDSSLVKSTPASMSTERAAGNLASVGNYIVCCGGFQYVGAENFYDNSNVKTTLTGSYGKNVQFPLGLSTNSYAVFFGGSTNSSAANAFADCKAWDSNKVLTSFNLPMAIWAAQGFSNGNYAVVCYQANELVYDDNLVLVSHTTDRNYGYGQAYLSGTADDFAMVKRNGTTELNIFDI